ncbi:MAG: tetratricopeptide repeat protein [Candidatus Bipolaricaulia bacterium]
MQRLHLFGQPELFDATGRPVSVRTSTSLHLLAYLWRYRGEAHARMRVAAQLWPETEESRARQNLRQALHHLRQLLDLPDDGGAYLDVDRQTIRMRADTPLWADVDAFEGHLHQAEDGDDADRVQHLEAAVAFYRGDFLESSDEDWAIEEREFLKMRYVEALDGLIDLCIRQGRREDAITYAERILAQHPLREDVHRRLMALYYERGDRSSALAQYRRLHQQLDVDLDISPDRETERLYRVIEANAPLGGVGPKDTPKTPSNLPHLLTRFHGRDEDVETIANWLEAQRLVTLTGVGGCGKTRSAVEAGHRLRERFADGVWFVDLAPLTDPHWIPQAIASTLNLAQTKIQALTDELIEHLRETRTLLILDNCEHLIDASARLAQRLLEACPHLAIVATSREAFHLSGERVWNVRPLAVPELPISRDELTEFAIVQLFLERARGLCPDFRLTDANAAAVARICRASEGIPLAVELAVTWLRVLSVGEIAERLGADPDLLTAQTRDVPPRHRSMRAVFEHSWNLLSERSQALFRRLSVFRGGFTRKAAEEVAGASLMQLAALLDQSLLERRADGRYVCHELLRQFGEAKLAACEETDEVRRRHLAFFLALAERAETELAGANQGEWLRCLTDELDNLRAALAWALETDRAEEALRLVTALGRFWGLRAYLSEGRQWLDRALQQLQQAEPATQAKALHQAGELAWRQGDYATAETYQQRSLARYRELGDDVGASQSLVGLGRTAQELGHLDRARELFEEGLSIERERGDQWGMARALGNLGEVTLEQGDPEAARDSLGQSLEMLREAGDRSGECNVLNKLGYVASVQGDVDGARSYLNESLAIARQVDDQRGIAMALGNLGNLALEQAEWDRARASLSEIAEIFREMNDRRNLYVALNKLGQVELARDDVAEARRHFDEALAICRRIDDQLGIAEVLCGLAETVRRDGHDRNAARLQGAIMALLEQVGASLQAHERRLFEGTQSSLMSELGGAAYQDEAGQGRAEGFASLVDAGA